MCSPKRHDLVLYMEISVGYRSATFSQFTAHKVSWNGIVIVPSPPEIENTLRLGKLVHRQHHVEALRCPVVLRCCIR